MKNIVIVNYAMSGLIISVQQKRENNGLVGNVLAGGIWIVSDSIVWVGISNHLSDNKSKVKQVQQRMVA